MDEITKKTINIKLNELKTLLDNEFHKHHYNHVNIYNSFFTLVERIFE